MTPVPGTAAAADSRRPVQASGARFMSWRDLMITPAVSLFTLLPPAVATYGLARHPDVGPAAGTALFASLYIVTTLLTLAVIRALRPFRPGRYRFDRSPWIVFQWNLHGYLMITNLGIQFTSLLVPPPFRKFFYACLGGRFGGGIVSLGGHLTDPFLTTIEENVMIGEGALLLGHAIVNRPDNLLILGPVTVRRGAIVGARSVVMPDVEIGENALVEACSFVRPHTRIGPDEVWGGNPAVRRRAGPPAERLQSAS